MNKSNFRIVDLRTTKFINAKTGKPLENECGYEYKDKHGRLKLFNGNQHFKVLVLDGKECSASVHFNFPDKNHWRISYLSMREFNAMRSFLSLTHHYQMYNYYFLKP